MVVFFFFYYYSPLLATPTQTSVCKINESYEFYTFIQVNIIVLIKDLIQCSAFKQFCLK